MSTATKPQPDLRLPEFLHTHGLASQDAEMQWAPLTGGVSSDIWRVDVDGRTLCVKCALPKLKVARDWHAPTSRNAYEWAWINFAFEHAPKAVPQPLAHDAELGAFAMEFLDGDTHPVWKSQLLAGVADAGTARRVAELLGLLHAASTRSPSLPQRFRTDDIFYSIRLEPYLVATAEAHPDLSSELRRLAESTLRTHKALVHGDVSPKNILVGPASPVFLDAECAWFGDPAFDVAFCLNHFLLKCLPQRAHAAGFLRCFDAFVDAYFAHVSWEEPRELERRAAQLLPALFLARIDGKSPVEYVTREEDKELVRKTARPLIARQASRLSEIAGAWGAILAQAPGPRT
ncbi:phosphotransferase family protein [Pollutimonas sp. M17]|uniref:phosphotransferase family protein n=1 Tax=Pollutimonas sp. M17 TaxID=2962065 RepID=UPI0021F448AC|nr:aminoglycoside phosphotransferase family protein [Pollutimonas sp. M17]UYO93445.1 aminoglycoside phosphotransferase family protein [Pollutimonas sp. M17]